MDLNEATKMDRERLINNRRSRLSGRLYLSEVTDRCRSVFNGSKKGMTDEIRTAAFKYQTAF
jgi:hypothetical protein